MSDLRSNEGFNSWDAIKYGGIALLGLGAYGALRRGVASSGTKAAIAKGESTAGSLLDLGGLGRAAKRTMNAPSFTGSEIVNGQRVGGLHGGLTDTTYERLGRGLKGLGGWAIAADRAGQAGRGSAVAARLGMVGAAGWAGSYVNPFTSDESRGTMGGALGTLAMAGAGAMAYGAGSRFLKSRRMIEGGFKRGAKNSGRFMKGGTVPKANTPVNSGGGRSWNPFKRAPKGPQEPVMPMGANPMAGGGPEWGGGAAQRDAALRRANRGRGRTNAQRAADVDYRGAGGVVTRRDAKLRALREEMKQNTWNQHKRHDPNMMLAELAEERKQTPIFENPFLLQQWEDQANLEINRAPSLFPRK